MGTSDSGERVKLSLERAEAMIAPGERVHTLRSTGQGLFIGAEWLRADLLAAMREAPALDLSGEVATAMGHGLAVLTDGSWLFVDTRGGAQ